MKLLFIFTLFAPWIVLADNIPQQQGVDKLIHDYTASLTIAEKEKLEALAEVFRKEHGVNLIAVLTRDQLKGNGSVFARELSNAWALANHSVILVADLGLSNYGIYRSLDLQQKLPDWVLDKILQNHIKIHFRRGEYFTGLQEAMTDIICLHNGSINPEILRKESSSSSFILVMALLVLILFFILVFPFLQYRAMKKSHFSSKKTDCFDSFINEHLWYQRKKFV